MRGTSKQSEAGNSTNTGTDQNAPPTGRHESASSTRSTDTVKGPFSSGRGSSMKLNTAAKKVQYVYSRIHAL
jgi:hypothetical protein